MIITSNQDTIRLLRECDAGITMGLSAIEQVMKSVKDADFRQMLDECKNKHDILNKDIKAMLDRADDSGKAPHPMAKSMAWFKTEVKLAADSSDSTAADIITDGCNMGIKSLSKYLNEYSTADKGAVDIAERLIAIEEKLAKDVRAYL